MDLTTFAHFLRVAEIGSINAAAGVLHVAQPTLSRQMAALEHELGARLFVRHRRGVSLTTAGEQLRGHAERILAEVERARGAVSASTQEPRGAVALGLPASMRYVLSGSVVSAYASRYPDVDLRVHEAMGNVIENLLRARAVDLAILISAARNLDNVDVTPLATEDVYLVGPPDTQLDVATPVPVSRLAEVPMILVAPENWLRHEIQRRLAREGLALRRRLEVEGQPLVLDLARRGAGFAALPFCAVAADLASGRLTGARIEGLTITWTLGVNRLRAHDPAVRELVRLIHEGIDSRLASGDWRVAPPVHVP
ncbi:MAG TPA: LysR family transcriptional regulator [Euzebyales bacterium]|nr:LysR family transcriptional regulator [Euzebyales bacterium]